jgi:hypothetical protein
MMSQNTFQVEKVASPKTTTQANTAKIRKGYQAPKLVVLGSSVELVQGNGNSVYQDGRGYYYRTK